MSDLVAQLVGALEDCLDRIEKSEFWWMDCPDRGGFDVDSIRAALSEAKAGGWVAVPVQVLEDASEAIGHFVSDHGWGDSDMQAMDNLDAYIATHKARTAPPAQRGEG